MVPTRELPSAPAAGTAERWCWDLLHEPDAQAKLRFERPPRRFEPAPVRRRVAAPARPPQRDAPGPARRSVRPGALVEPAARARLLHTFCHHELQAAELMAWALLTFADAPARFRRGLAAIAFEELVHAGLLADQVRRLGHELGDFRVRDWFWERVPTCRTPAQFVALLGVGLEGANLDHAAHWAAHLRAAGDEDAARVQDRIAREEIAHVRFAARWLARFTGGADFESWRGQLPPPLTPTILRGRALDRGARRKAGLDSAFSDALEAWCEDGPRS